MSLIQLVGCVGCDLAQAEIRDSKDRTIGIKQEICKYGGKVAIQKGNGNRFSCYRTTVKP